MVANNTPIADAAMAELGRWLAQANQPYEPRYKSARRDARAMVTRFMPSVLARLAEAERERDELREIILNYRRKVHILHQHNQFFERCESGWCNPSPKRTDFDENDPAGLWEALGGMIDNAAARDAQQRREGAAEWIEGECRTYGQLFGFSAKDYSRSIEKLLAEAKRLREGK